MENNDVRETLKRNVKALRKARGLTQEQLAEMIGKSVDTVSNIERGFLSTRIQTAADIADALDVQFPDLFRSVHQSEEEQRRVELTAKILAIVEKGDSEALEAVENVVDSIVKLRNYS